MKEIYVINEKLVEGQTKPQHILFGTDKVVLQDATRYTNARLKIKWDIDNVQVFMCTNKAFEFFVQNQMYGGFDPYEIDIHSEVYLKVMKRKNIRFYKEVQVL